MEGNDPNGATLQLLLLLIVLVPAVLFLLTEYNTVRAVRTENRLINPGLIWVQLIPFIGQIWQFLVVTPAPSKNWANGRPLESGSPIAH
jgi:hypothetical protein